MGDENVDLSRETWRNQHDMEHNSTNMMYLLQRMVMMMIKSAKVTMMRKRTTFFWSSCVQDSKNRTHGR